jgi:hypothetical protein
MSGAAAIDVARGHRNSVHPHPAPVPAGRPAATVWTVKARTDAVHALGRQLQQDGSDRYA